MSRAVVFFRRGLSRLCPLRHVLEETRLPLFSNVICGLHATIASSSVSASRLRSTLFSWPPDIQLASTTTCKCSHWQKRREKRASASSAAAVANCERGCVQTRRSAPPPPLADRTEACAPAAHARAPVNKQHRIPPLHTQRKKHSYTHVRPLSAAQCASTAIMRTVKTPHAHTEFSYSTVPCCSALAPYTLVHLPSAPFSTFHHLLSHKSLNRTQQQSQARNVEHIT